jgi:hypothetical protein
VLIERDREVEKLLELLSGAVDGEGRLVFSVAKRESERRP